MTRRMLINAQTREELRVAIVDGDTLENFQVEVADRSSTRGNIYRGTIAKIEPSLNAAFIDYGAERHGFLAIQDVVEQAWYRKPKKGGKGSRPRIEEVLEQGRPIVVQVTKEAEGTKGAALTTNLSLAGRYLVLTPFDDTRGISRKVDDDATRKQLKERIQSLDTPDGCGFIVRTNAADQTKAALSRDLAALLRMWKRIGSAARRSDGRRLIYDDQDLVLQALRDYLDPSIEEILVDDGEVYARAEEYMKAYMPRGQKRLSLYGEREPLFSRYGIEPQIDRIYERRVYLPSGGHLVIDRTEALLAIDVNSGRSTGASSQEQTAVATNLEAAAEVARQLRLRDLGGLVVVDFIDMRSNRNQRKVEKALRDAMKDDKARFSVGRISDNGLLEINRQRIHQALTLRTHRTCPTCDGTGSVPSPEMVGLNLLRRIRGRASTAPVAKVRIALHPELATTVQNQRRHELAELEREFDLRVEVLASPRLNLREQEVEWEKRESGNGRPATPAVRTASVRVGDEAAAVAGGDGRETAPREEERHETEKDAEGEKDKRKDGERRSRRRRSRRSTSRSRSSRSRSAGSADRGDGGRERKKAEATGTDGKGDGDASRPRRRRRRRRSSRSSKKGTGARGAASKGAASDGEGRSRKRTSRSREGASQGSDRKRVSRKRESDSGSGSSGEGGSGGGGGREGGSKRGSSRSRRSKGDGKGGSGGGRSRRRRSERGES